MLRSLLFSPKMFKNSRSTFRFYISILWLLDGKKWQTNGESEDDIWNCQNYKKKKDFLRFRLYRDKTIKQKQKK